MPEIVYVDEQPSEANQVLRSAVNSGYFTQDQVTAVPPNPTLEETIESILPHGCKALIADYRLSEHMASVQFTGVELVREYQRRFHEFPCFVATSFADEAIRESIDANIVFPKSEFLLASDSSESSDSEVPFFLRVRRKVDEYTSLMELTVSEFNKLAAASAKGELGSEKVERLLRLDDMVERLRGQHLALPSHLKKGQALATFGDLIERAEMLIHRIENQLKGES